MINDESFDTRIPYAIKRAHHAQRIAMDHALRELGLTAPQWSVLMCLRYQGGMSNAELARHNDCTPQTMNEIVRHLEAAGLVERERHPTHGIIQPARLTPAGEALLTECKQRISALQARVYAALTEEQRTALLDGLTRWSAALQEDVESGCPLEA